MKYLFVRLPGYFVVSFNQHADPCGLKQSRIRPLPAPLSPMSIRLERPPAAVDAEHVRMF